MGPVPPMGPQEISTVGDMDGAPRSGDEINGGEVRGAGAEGAVEEACEEEGGGDQEEGSDLVRAGAKRLLVVVLPAERSGFVVNTTHFRTLGMSFRLSVAGVVLPLLGKKALDENDVGWHCV